MVLDALFITVFHWGLAGAAIATVIGQLIGAGVPIALFFSARNNWLLKLGKAKFDGHALLKACTNGSSEFLSNVSMSLVGMLYNAQLLKYAGNDGVVAYGVIMYVNIFFIAVFFGFSVGTSPVFSFNYGADNGTELKSLFRKCASIILGSSVIMLLAAEVLARPLAMIFTSYDQSLLDMTTHAFAIYSVSFLFCGIGIAAFADMVAGTFNAFGADGALVEAAQTNGAAGMVSIMFMVFAVVFGLIQKKFNFSGWKESVISIVFIVLSFVIGANLPLILGKAAWSYITFVYIFFAAVLPMWLLKQPRDHMTTFMFVAMIAGAVVGLLVAHPTMNLPVFTGFTNEKLGTMFPILFVTVACGAVSGFHGLVSSGTSSKTVENEKDMLKVGYGAMALESLLAVLALCVAGAAAAADGTPAAGTPFQIFSRGVAGFFEMFGVPAYAATVFMTMCVSALALTSLDAVARIGRMSFQELFSVDDMEHAEGWRKLLCNVYFSTFITLVFGFILTKIGYANIWPLFGSANQLLSALVLATLCVFPADHHALRHLHRSGAASHGDGQGHQQCRRCHHPCR